MRCLSNQTPVGRIRSSTASTSQVPRHRGGGGELFKLRLKENSGNLIISVIKASPDLNGFPVCMFLCVCICIYSFYFKAGYNRKKVIEQ